VDLSCLRGFHMGALGSRIPNIREVRGDEQCNTHFLPSFMRLRYVKQVVSTIPSFLFSAIILRSSSRYLSLDVNKPLSTADGKRSRRNILAKLCTAPSLTSFLPPLARRVLESKQRSSLAPIVSYPILQSPRFSFFHRPRSHFDRTRFGVGGCSTAQPQATEKFALTPAGGRSKMQPMAKILLSHPHRSFAFDHLLSKVDCGSFVCFHSPHVCFRPQDGLRSAFAGLRSLRPFLSLFSFGTSLHLLSLVLTRSRYCPAPVRFLE
jgi:hypothetical protein